jgi:hypothetical protein
MGPQEPQDVTRDIVRDHTATVEGTGDGDMKAVKDRGGTAMTTDYTFSFTTSVCVTC